MKHSIKISFFVSVFVSYLLWKWGVFASPRMQVQDLRTILGVIAQISATMLGFLLAALAVLASISGSRLIKNMQKTGHYTVLLNQFFFNTIAFGVSMAIAVGSCVLNARITEGAVLTSGFFVFSCLVLCDVGWRFWLVLTEISG